MRKGTHGTRQQSFEELDFKGQAKAINGTARTIEKEIVAHIRRAANENRDVIQIRQTYKELLQRIINRL